MMVMLMMMCKCVTVSVCLYRFTSAARFFKDTIHVPPLTFTLFGRQKELYTPIAAYLLLEKESILELSLLPGLTGQGPQNEDIYVQIRGQREFSIPGILDESQLHFFSLDHEK